MIHDARGWWLAQEPPLAPRPALAGDVTADIVIVGGGFTGMWAAWLAREQEPGARVAIVEADLCGHGPSGRNGGFVNTSWFSLRSMTQRFGVERALAVARAADAAVGEIGAWCDEQGIDAWFRTGGYMIVSTAPAFDAEWQATVRACAEAGEPQAARTLSAEEVRARCAAPAFGAGAFLPASATVNPARLALGLRAKLLDAGVEIYERSPARAIANGPGSVEVRTAGGRLRARHMVLAAGGALEALRPLRRRMTLTSSHMVMTEPVPDLLEEIGWTGGECITDARHMLHYFRTTPDGRIAFGWGGGRVVAGARTGGRAEVDPAIVARVIRDLRRFFPALAGRRIEHAWGGPVDVSPSHTPVVGSLGRLHYGFGYTGHGVGPSRMVGHALAALALERDDDHTRLAIVEPPPLRVPPEPLRYIGGVITRAALVRKEAALESGRAPGRVTNFIAGLPGRLGVQIGR